MASEPPAKADRPPAAIVLAAGQGVRMHSSLPKVLHPVGGIPMLRRVVGAVHKAGIETVVAVLPPDCAAERDALPQGTAVAIQCEARGTGDAVAAGLAQVPPGVGTVLVVGADTPLVTPETLAALVEKARDATIAVAAATLADPRGYGRVVLAAPGRAARIVEEADTTPEELAIALVNGMLFAFDAAWLRAALPRVEPSASGEIYLTAVIGEATRAGGAVHVVETEDPWEVVGVNTRAQLAQVEGALRDRVNRILMDAGVTLLDPGSTFVEESVIVGQDVVIHPQCFLRGQTVIGDWCTIGPGAEIISSRIGSESRIWWSVVEGADVGARVRIGPYCRVRPGTRLETEVMLGSFAEVKNSSLGARTQMHHFSYLGDAEVGPDVNIGAGAITCNFDGVEKHRTIIEEGVFVGSATMLVAPVTLGKGSATGAGSVVTRDVPPGKLVVGMPARVAPRKRTGDGDWGLGARQDAMPQPPSPNPQPPEAPR